MQILKLSGTPRQVGQQYGEACRSGFHELNASVHEKAAENQSWLSDIQHMKASIAAHFGSILDEMKGAAEGANLALDDVLLNHRAFVLAAHLDSPCCTNIAFLQPDEPVFGKNLDLAPNPERDYAIRDVSYADGTRLVHSVVVGELTSRDTCMNGHGLTIGGSSVGSVFQQSTRHVPLETGLYAMLCSCATVTEAIEFLQERPWLGKGYNFCLVDAAGNGVIVECACPLVQFRWAQPDTDAIFCTNSYKLPALKHADLRTSLGMRYSELRYKYLEKRLFKEDAPRNADTMKKLLSSYGSEGGLCRPIDDGDPSKTRMSVIAMPASRQFKVADGQPSMVPFETIWA